MKGMVFAEEICVEPVSFLRGKNDVLMGI